MLIVFSTKLNQEKMREQRGRLPVLPLGYVMSTKVIFRRAEVSVLGEVNGFLVSKETVVLRRWERSNQKSFGFFKRVDKG